MNKKKRFMKILDILKTGGNASTKYLAAIFQISEAIISRDLTELTGSDLFPVGKESSWMSNIFFRKVEIIADVKYKNFSISGGRRYSNS